MKRTLLTIAAAAFASQAAAGQCPMLATQIEEALAAAPGLPADTRAAVTAMLEEGLRLHGSGDHAGSEAALGAAMQMLGIAPV